MRVLITGAGGQLGHDLVERFGDHEVLAADHASLDVADRDAVLGLVTTRCPDLVIHAAAWTAVDACEDDPEKAFRVNALGTRHVADACRRIDARVVYVSTDYVFDGEQDEPYLEWDEPNPRSVYGRSKLAGERELDPGSTVVRTSWVCGEHGNNMVKTILRLSDEHDTLRFVDDQRGHPSFTVDLARVIRDLAVRDLPGVFHATNQGVVSWYEFARVVLEVSGQDPDRVRPIATADLDPPRPAPRPANSVLENFAVREVGVEPAPHFRSSLEQLVARLRP